MARPIHYGWFVVAAGRFAFAGLGFSCFAFGMLLPSMGASLGLSFSQMGLISTSNFVGYRIAVLLVRQTVSPLRSMKTD